MSQSRAEGGFLWRHHPALLFLLPGLCLVVVLSGCSTSAKRASRASAQPEEDQWTVDSSHLATFVPVGTLQREATFADYTVRVYRDANLPSFPVASFEILKGGKRVWAQVGNQFFIGLPRDEWAKYEQQPKPPKPKSVTVHVGQDITGGGNPDLVVSEWTGGAHCCFLTHVFEIGSRFRHLATIDAEHDDMSYFADLTGNGTLQFVTADSAFAYWRVSFAESPAPTIILRYAGGEYRLAADLMRKPAPADGELQARAEALRRSDEWCDDCDEHGHPCPPSEELGRDCPPSELWREMLDLIYAGQAEAAWRFFDLVWTRNCKDRTKFLEDFRHQLRESTYWHALNAMNYGRL